MKYERLKNPADQQNYIIILLFKGRITRKANLFYEHDEHYSDF